MRGAVSDGFRGSIAQRFGSDVKPRSKDRGFHLVARFGGDEGTRTPDPRDANAVLFQLSYIPTRGRSLAQPSRPKPGNVSPAAWDETYLTAEGAYPAAVGNSYAGADILAGSAAGCGRHSRVIGGWE